MVFGPPKHSNCKVMKHHLLECVRAWTFFPILAPKISRLFYCFSSWRIFLLLAMHGKIVAQVGFIFFLPKDWRSSPLTLWQTNIAMEYHMFNRKYIFKGSIFQPAMLDDPGVYTSWKFQKGIQEVWKLQINEPRKRKNI